MSNVPPASYLDMRDIKRVEGDADRAHFFIDKDVRWSDDQLNYELEMDFKQWLDATDVRLYRTGFDSESCALVIYMPDDSPASRDELLKVINLWNTFIQL
jgi:hypothetical protein